MFFLTSILAHLGSGGSVSSDVSSDSDNNTDNGPVITANSEANPNNVLSVYVTWITE